MVGTLSSHSCPCAQAFSGSGSAQFTLAGPSPKRGLQRGTGPGSQARPEPSPSCPRGNKWLLRTAGPCPAGPGSVPSLWSWSSSEKEVLWGLLAMGPDSPEGGQLSPQVREARPNRVQASSRGGPWPPVELGWARSQWAGGRQSFSPPCPVPCGTRRFSGSPSISVSSSGLKQMCNSSLVLVPPTLPALRKWP